MMKLLNPSSSNATPGNVIPEEGEIVTVGGQSYLRTPQGLIPVNN